MGGSRFRPPPGSRHARHAPYRLLCSCLLLALLVATGSSKPDAQQPSAASGDECHGDDARSATAAWRTHYSRPPLPLDPHLPHPSAFTFDLPQPFGSVPLAKADCCPLGALPLPLPPLPKRPRMVFALGAMKGGSTTLYQLLTLHPQIASWRKRYLYRIGHLGDLFRDKESHFFSASPITTHRAVDEYLRGWDHAHPDALWLDGTPENMHLPAVACRIRAAFPDARLIISLRDPLLRAVSHHQHETRMIWNKHLNFTPFDARVRRELAILAQRGCTFSRQSTTLFSAVATSPARGATAAAPAAAAPAAAAAAAAAAAGNVTAEQLESHGFILRPSRTGKPKWVRMSAAAKLAAGRKAVRDQRLLEGTARSRQVVTAEAHAASRAQAGRRNAVTSTAAPAAAAAAAAAAATPAATAARRLSALPTSGGAATAAAAATATAAAALAAAAGAATKGVAASPAAGRKASWNACFRCYYDDVCHQASRLYDNSAMRRHCVRDRKRDDLGWMAMRGMYAPIIANWLRFFPSDQIYVVNMQDQIVQLPEIFRFLGLPAVELEPNTTAAALSRVRQHSGERVGKGACSGVTKLAGPALRQLDRLYREQNRELYQLMNVMGLNFTRFSSPCDATGGGSELLT